MSGLVQPSWATPAKMVELYLLDTNHRGTIAARAIDVRTTLKKKNLSMLN